jgi:DNA-nicking Smr family endonuclease
MKTDKYSLNETMLNIADIDEDVDSVDLHGMSIHQAKLEVDQFISCAHFHRKQVVKIICGAGTGVLADAIWEFVQKHPMVQLAKSRGAIIYAAL